MCPLFRDGQQINNILVYSPQFSICFAVKRSSVEIFQSRNGYIEEAKKKVVKMAETVVEKATRIAL